MNTTIHYLSIDPGGSNGWAAWDKEGNLLTMGTAVGEQDYFKMLYEHRAQVYIVEDFKLFPHMRKEMSWQDFPTVQMIGAAKFVAYLQGAQFVLQPPSIKKIAYMQSGLTPSKNKAGSHSLDAVVHGYWYLIQQSIRKRGPL